MCYHFQNNAIALQSNVIALQSNVIALQSNVTSPSKQCDITSKQCDITVQVLRPHFFNSEIELMGQKVSDRGLMSLRNIYVKP